jgi:hypothetical protein
MTSASYFWIQSTQACTHTHTHTRARGRARSHTHTRVNVHRHTLSYSCTHTYNPPPHARARAAARICVSVSHSVWARWNRQEMVCTLPQHEGDLYTYMYSQSQKQGMCRGSCGQGAAAKPVGCTRAQPRPPQGIRWQVGRRCSGAGKKKTQTFGREQTDSVTEIPNISDRRTNQSDGVYTPTGSAGSPNAGTNIACLHNPAYTWWHS